MYNLKMNIMNTQTHTEQMDEGMFLLAFLVAPIFLFIVFVPMPYGWSEMNLGMEAFRHTDTYLFIACSVGMIAYLTKISAEYKREYGKSLWSSDDNISSEKTNNVVQMHESVNSARIVRKNGTITIFDENDRIVYKKL